LAVAMPAVAAVASARTVTVADEFQRPSWTSLPSRSIFNQLPSCTLDQTNDYICLPPISGTSQPADPYSPEAYVNSAYWPAEQRPDIERYAMNRYGYDYENCARYTVHYCFYVDAKKVGYPISHEPKAGDLAVFPEACAARGPSTAVSSNCVADSGSYWYVMYVQRVLAGGAYIGSGGGASDSSNVNNIDSGIVEEEVSENSDRYTYFIGLMPKQRKLAPPKHRRAEPSTLIRFRAYPTTEDPALKVRFWLNKEAPSVKVELEEQYGPDSSVTLKNVAGGSHYVSLRLSSSERKQFSIYPYVRLSYELTVGSFRYQAPTVTIASAQPAPQTALSERLMVSLQ
jgi:hypothetical protein